MRAFDWVRFFREQNVEYVERGANIKRGEIGIRCPFCGSADPSHHMGLSLDTGWWSCWRNKAMHSGKSPLRLIMKLLGVSYGQARELAGLGDDYVDPEGFSAMAARILHKIKSDGGPVPADERRFLTLDEYPIIADKIRTRKFWNYLYSDRGFNGTWKGLEDVDRLCQEYNLRAGVDGLWNDRIILPYYHDGVLVTWTGRALSKSATIRYRDLDLKSSFMGPKETLYNHDCIATGGKVLVVQEGPFDALKVDFYGKLYGVRSTAMSTNSITQEQSFLLKEAESRFDRILICLDAKTEFGLADGMRMKQQLGFIRTRAITVPYGADDGGSLTPAQAVRWAIELTS